MRHGYGYGRQHGYGYGGELESFVVLLIIIALVVLVITIVLTVRAIVFICQTLHRYGNMSKGLWVSFWVFLGTIILSCLLAE